jgi:RNA polymerase sigma-70 factor (TIGR02943 family)
VYGNLPASNQEMEHHSPMDRHDPDTGTAATQAAPHELADPAFLTELRGQMLKFAVMQLEDAQPAEDAVQEALVGALRNVGSFGRRSALKTWVFAILKNKITDTLRRRKHPLTASDLGADGGSDDSIDMLFDRRGFWLETQHPARWTRPEAAIHDAHFWRVFEACLEGLPEKQSRFFMMREFLELDTDAICEQEGISVSNLQVQLYRARLRLRECLENRWFL